MFEVKAKFLFKHLWMTNATGFCCCFYPILILILLLLLLFVLFKRTIFNHRRLFVHIYIFYKSLQALFGPKYD